MRRSILPGVSSPPDPDVAPAVLLPLIPGGSHPGPTPKPKIVSRLRAHLCRRGLLLSPRLRPYCPCGAPRPRASRPKPAAGQYDRAAQNFQTRICWTHLRFGVTSPIGRNRRAPAGRAGNACGSRVGIIPPARSHTEQAWWIPPAETTDNLMQGGVPSRRRMLSWRFIPRG